MSGEMSDYAAFGLQLTSEIELPELPPGRGPADVTVRFGSTPAPLPQPVVESVLYQAAPGSFRLEVPNVATYLATGGSEVVVAPQPDAAANEVRLFLYGSVMGSILQQRGILTLHASAVTDGERAILFAGPSGRGKSTLAAAFLDWGYRLLADDVVAIRTEPVRGAVAAAGYPQIKLWADALRHLNIEIDQLPRVRDQLDKAYLPAGKRFADGPVPVSHVYVLQVHNRDDFVLTAVTGRDKLGFLVRNTYRGNFLDGLGGKQAHFQGCVTLSRDARVVSVVRPRTDFRIEELRDRIETDLEESTGAS